MIKVGKTFLLASILALLLVSGCRRSSLAPSRRAPRIVRLVPSWGPETEGLQLRLRPTRRVWSADETITFKLDIRNQGKRLFAFNAAEPIEPDRLSVDDRWRRWPEARTAAKMRPLGPGAELADLTLALSPLTSVSPAPGRHSLRVALILEGVEAVSNEVAVEITAAP